jgi:thioredoxin-related protein
MGKNSQKISTLLLKNSIVLIALIILSIFVTRSLLKNESFVDFKNYDLQGGLSLEVKVSRPKEKYYLLIVSSDAGYLLGNCQLVYLDSEELGEIETKELDESFEVSIFNREGALSAAYRCKISDGYQRWEVEK